MSKKMMKRSLALGALMAFVITGSAMAASINATIDSDSENFNSYQFNDVYENVYLTNNGGGLFSGKSVTIHASNEIKLTANNVHAIYSGNVDLSAPSIEIIGKGKADGVYLYGTGTNGKLSGFDELQVTADINHAVMSQGGSKIDIIGKPGSTVTLKSEEGYGLMAYGGTINVETDTLKVSSNGATATGRPVYVYDGQLSINVDNLYVENTNKDATRPNFSVYNGTANVEVRGEAVVPTITLYDRGVLNFVANGDDASLKGQIVTSELGGEANITLNGATWDVTGASTVTNATFSEGSVLKIGKGYEAEFDKITGEALTDGDYAITAVGEKTSLTIANGAKLQIEGIKETTYNIAKDFEKYDVADILEIADNALMEANKKITGNYYQVEVVAKKAEQIAEDLGVSETTGDFLNSIVEGANESGVDVSEGTAGGKLVGLANAAAKSNNDVVKAKAAAQAVEAVQKMAEAGGNSATAANVVTNVTNVTGQRLSFSGGNAGGNKGGHGVGLLEEGSGAAIWAQYVHGKDSVEDMPSEAGASSYEGQYNGIVMGVDFKKVGKFQSGIAFNYGEGDTNSVNTTSPTRSEYDFWGIGYYGNIRNADSNVIFDIGYAKTDSDVTSNVIAEGYAETFEASPETTTWTAGVKLEKLYQNENVQIVPYTGLRYMSIDPEDYTTKCGAMGYKMERQDIWLLPVGVSIKQEIVNPNGWVVTPKVDLSYIWAFGDTDSSMETNTVFGSDNRPIGYDVMDDGSWMGLVGVEAAMDDWTFGVSYSYQKGDHSESKKWYVDAKYSF